jgi:hypothetical protein
MLASEDRPVLRKETTKLVPSIAYGWGIRPLNIFSCPRKQMNVFLILSHSDIAFPNHGEGGTEPGLDVVLCPAFGRLSAFAG